MLQKPPLSPQQPRVEFQLRWFLLLVSAIVLFALRQHRALLIGYSGLVAGSVALYTLWLPGRVKAAERRFARDTLKLMASDDAAGVRSLADKQLLLRTFGPKHLLPDARGMAAAAAGDHSQARVQFLRALEAAPSPLRPRIQLNLARSEMQLGLLDEAEGRYRGILHRRGGMVSANAQLGRVLVMKGQDFEEAATHLRTGLQNADRRDLVELNLALAEALKCSGQSGWEAALDTATELGADTSAVSRVRTLSSSQSMTRG